MLLNRFRDNHRAIDFMADEAGEKRKPNFWGCVCVKVVDPTKSSSPTCSQIGTKFPKWVIALHTNRG